jgi:hypothetical protein
MHDEKADAQDRFGAEVIRGGKMDEEAKAQGQFTMECRGPDGRLKWREDFDNIVTTVGKNLALDTFLAGSAYTVVGPFLGLISSVSYGAGPVLGDTMTSHGGWTEAGGTNAPQYTAPRPTTNAGWNTAAAGAKALTAAKAFAITTAGTVKGAFLVYGSGALSTIDNTAGTLYSAGTFAADKVVGIGDTLNVSYSASL